jgi:hypothetical protein
MMYVSANQKAVSLNLYRYAAARRVVERYKSEKSRDPLLLAAATGGAVQVEGVRSSLLTLSYVDTSLTSQAYNSTDSELQRAWFQLLSLIK